MKMLLLAKDTNYEVTCTFWIARGQHETCIQHRNYNTRL